ARGQWDDRNRGGDLARGPVLPLFWWGCLRHRRCRDERLVAFSAWHRRAAGICADRNRHPLFRPGLALWRIFPLPARLRRRNDVAVDCRDPLYGDPYRTALSHGSRADTVAGDFRLLALDLRPHGPYRLRAGRLVLRARFHSSRPTAARGTSRCPGA